MIWIYDIIYDMNIIYWCKKKWIIGDSRGVSYLIIVI